MLALVVSSDYMIHLNGIDQRVGIKLGKIAYYGFK